MATTTTTATSAIAVNDNSIVVASANGFAAGYFARIDKETVRVSKAYVSGLTILLDGRGLDGSERLAHPSGVSVTVGSAVDWAQPGPAGSQASQFQTQPVSDYRSYSASGALTLPSAGRNMTAVLNGTSVLAMTLANPTQELNGSRFVIVANGAAAHTVTYSAGLGNAGGNYDVLTANGTGLTSVELIAIGGFWTPVSTITGTQTNIGWAIS